MRTTILILSNSDSGLCDFRKELLQELVSKGYEVHVSVPDTGYVERIRGFGCHCIETALDRRGMNPVRDGKLLLFYLRLIRKYKPDAVLTYTVKPNIYGGLAARLSGTVYMTNITGLGDALEKESTVQKILVMLYRIALKKVACVFFQNQRNLEFMRQKGCITGKTRIIAGSGVNLAEMRRSRIRQMRNCRRLWSVRVKRRAASVRMRRRSRKRRAVRSRSGCSASCDC